MIKLLYLTILCISSWHLSICRYIGQHLPPHSVPQTYNPYGNYRYSFTPYQVPHQMPGYSPPGTYIDQRSGIVRPFPGGGMAMLVDYHKRCSNQYVGLKPHPEDRQFYYVCKRDCVIFGKCQRLQYFNATRGQCVQYSPPTYVPTCKAIGRFPIYSDCHLYYKCDADLKPLIYACPYNMIFSQEKEKCIPGNRCIPTQIASNGQNIPEYCENKYPPCMQNGVFRSPSDCALYYTCAMQNHGVYLQTRFKCPDDTFYDLQRNGCFPQEEVPCDCIQVAELVYPKSSVHPYNYMVVHPSEFDVDSLVENNYPTETSEEHIEDEDSGSTDNDDDVDDSHDCDRTGVKTSVKPEATTVPINTSSRALSSITTTAITSTVTNSPTDSETILSTDETPTTRETTTADIKFPPEDLSTTETASQTSPEPSPESFSKTFPETTTPDIQLTPASTAQSVPPSPDAESTVAISTLTKPSTSAATIASTSKPLPSDSADKKSSEGDSSETIVLDDYIAIDDDGVLSADTNREDISTTKAPKDASASVSAEGTEILNSETDIPNEEFNTEKVTTEKSITEKPDSEESATENPTTEETSTEIPTTEKPTTEEPITEKPTTEEPITEIPTTEKPTTEKPTTQKPTTENPTTEEPITEKPTTEQPITEKPTTEELTTEKHTTKEPTTEKHTTGKPVTGETTADQSAATSPLFEITEKQPPESPATEPPTSWTVSTTESSEPMKVSSKQPAPEESAEGGDEFDDENYKDDTFEGEDTKEDVTKNPCDNLSADSQDMPPHCKIPEKTQTIPFPEDQTISSDETQIKDDSISLPPTTTTMASTSETNTPIPIITTEISTTSTTVKALETTIITTLAPATLTQTIPISKDQTISFDETQIKDESISLPPTTTTMASTSETSDTTNTTTPIPDTPKLNPTTTTDISTTSATVKSFETTIATTLAPTTLAQTIPISEDQTINSDETQIKDDSISLPPTTMTMASTTETSDTTNTTTPIPDTPTLNPTITTDISSTPATVKSLETTIATTLAPTTHAQTIPISEDQTINSDETQIKDDSISLPPTTTTMASTTKTSDTITRSTTTITSTATETTSTTFTPITSTLAPAAPITTTDAGTTTTPMTVTISTTNTTIATSTPPAIPSTTPTATEQPTTSSVAVATTTAALLSTTPATTSTTADTPTTPTIPNTVITTTTTAAPTTGDKTTTTITSTTATTPTMSIATSPTTATVAASTHATIPFTTTSTQPPTTAIRDTVTTTTPSTLTQSTTPTKLAIMPATTLRTATHPGDVTNTIWDSFDVTSTMGPESSDDFIDNEFIPIQPRTRTHHGISSTSQFPPSTVALNSHDGTTSAPITLPHHDDHDDEFSGDFQFSGDGDDFQSHSGDSSENGSGDGYVSYMHATDPMDFDGEATDEDKVTTAKCGPDVKTSPAENYIQTTKAPPCPTTQAPPCTNTESTGSYPSPPYTAPMENVAVEKIAPTPVISSDCTQKPTTPLYPTTVPLSKPSDPTDIHLCNDNKLAIHMRHDLPQSAHSSDDKNTIYITTTPDLYRTKPVINSNSKPVLVPAQGPCKEEKGNIPRLEIIAEEPLDVHFMICPKACKKEHAHNNGSSSTSNRAVLLRWFENKSNKTMGFETSNQIKTDGDVMA